MMKTKSMKMLHINTADKYGGAENVAFELLSTLGGNMLVKNKHRDATNIAVIKRSLFSYFLEAIDSFLFRLFKKTLFSDFGVAFNIHQTWAFLKKNAWYQEAETVVLHNLHGGYFDLQTLEKISKEKNVIWILHDMWAATGGEAHAINNNHLKNESLHASLRKMYPLKNPIIDFRKKYLESKKRIYRNSPNICFVSVSKWMAHDLKKAYVAHPNMDIRVIRNGIDTNVFKNLKQRHEPIPQVLFFNTNSPFKGGELFREIVAELPPTFKLLTVGELVEGYKNQEQIIPTYDPVEMNTIYNRADILIFPSKIEALGLVALEAMACGAYVIASDQGGGMEIIKENHGQTFYNNDAQSLKNTIIDCLALSLKEIRQQGERNSQNIITHWSKEKMMNDYLYLLFKK